LRNDQVNFQDESLWCQACFLPNDPSNYVVAHSLSIEEEFPNEEGATEYYEEEIN